MSRRKLFVELSYSFLWATNVLAPCLSPWADQAIGSQEMPCQLIQHQGLAKYP